MRRIDLFCKLIGPLVIAIIDSASPRIAVLITGSMTAASVLIEYTSIARVFHRVPALQLPKPTTPTPTSRPTLRHRLHTALSGLSTYVHHRAFLPSFALALLYLTVLSFSGQMITYLLALGLPSGLIGALRGVAAVFELSATWLGPKVMRHIGPIRAGIWFVNWEILCVGVACVFFWLEEPLLSPMGAAVGTVAAVIASRVGLWGFDLSAQMIVQEVSTLLFPACHITFSSTKSFSQILISPFAAIQEVEPSLRGTFSSHEFALQNTFEMLAFASTIIWPRPEEFRYPATISAAAVGAAGVLYAVFVRARRGHLVHLSSCVDPAGKRARKDHSHWWMGHGGRWRRVDDHDGGDHGDEERGECE